MRSGKQVRLNISKNTQNFKHTRSTIVDSWIELRKLSRLKYLQLQTNKYLSQFLEIKLFVSMIAAMDSLIFEYTNTMNIVGRQSCLKVFV